MAKLAGLRSQMLRDTAHKGYCQCNKRDGQSSDWIHIISLLSTRTHAVLARGMNHGRRKPNHARTSSVRPSVPFEQWHERERERAWQMGRARVCSKEDINSRSRAFNACCDEKEDELQDR